VSDLKSRWDHKVWWFFWTVLGITWIIIFAKSAEFTPIAAEFPIYEPILISAANLTYPHFCIRGLEGSSTITPSCWQNIAQAKHLMASIQVPADTCFGPKTASTQGCVCFNNYAILKQGTSTEKYGYPDSPNPIQCDVGITVGSALLWVCDPMSDGSCGDAYGTPMGTHFAPLPSGMFSFIGMTLSYIRNTNYKLNATDYALTVNHRPLDPMQKTSAQFALSFNSYRIFHYIPIDEFTGFRWLLFISTFAFFFICIHNLAFTLVRVLFLRTSPVKSGWGPVDGVVPGVSRAPSLAPPPLTQPEGVKGYNTL